MKKINKLAMEALDSVLNEVVQAPPAAPPAEIQQYKLPAVSLKDMSPNAIRQSKVSGYHWLTSPDTETTVGAVGMGEALTDISFQRELAERDAFDELVKKAAIVAGILKPGDALKIRVGLNNARITNYWTDRQEHVSYARAEVSKADFVKLIQWLRQKYPPVKEKGLQ